MDTCLCIGEQDEVDVLDTDDRNQVIPGICKLVGLHIGNGNRLGPSKKKNVVCIRLLLHVLSQSNDATSSDAVDNNHRLA